MTCDSPSFRNAINTICNVDFQTFVTFTRTFANSTFVWASLEGNMSAKNCEDIAIILSTLNYYPVISGWKNSTLVYLYFFKLHVHYTYVHIDKCKKLVNFSWWNRKGLRFPWRKGAFASKVNLGKKRIRLLEIAINLQPISTKHMLLSSWIF